MNRFTKAVGNDTTDTRAARAMSGKRSAVPPTKSGIWNDKRWDKKCKAPFAEYKPSNHPRLS